MPWVERDGSNNIIGRYALKQPGTAEEFLEPTDPEILALGSGVVKAPLYSVNEYFAHRLTKITKYATDNGDGTYSDKVEETEYTYIGNKIKDLTHRVFFDDGVLKREEKIEFFTGDGGEFIEKES